MSVPSHVVYITCLHTSEISSHSLNGTVDIIIGTIITICLLAGLAGNLSAFTYFCQNRNKSLYLTLLIIISVTDICLSFILLPVALSLFNTRSPTLFNSHIVCGIWTILFNFSERVSVFSVLLLTITRRLTLLLPRYKINKLSVLRACVLFGGVLLAVQFVVTWSGEVEFRYRSYESSCAVVPGVTPPGDSWVYYLLLLPVLTLVMVVVIFVCFMVTSVVLIAGEKNHREEDIREETVTITLFTSVFLVCNLPRFVLLILQLCLDTANWLELETIFKQNPVLYWYRVVVSQFLFTALKVLLNPIIYAVRFKKFRGMVLRSLGRSAVEPAPTQRINVRGKH